MAAEYSNLHRAVMSGDIQEVRRLITVENINTTDGAFALTALHLACIYQHPHIVELLLRNKNIDVNAKDKTGAIPMTYATVKGNMKIVNMLLSDGRVDQEHVYSNDWGGPMYSLAVTNKAETLQLLLKKYYQEMADSDLLNPRTLARMLERSCYHGHVDTAKTIMSFGDCDVNAYSDLELGFTPLQTACYHGQTSIVKMLMTHLDIDLKKPIKGNEYAPGDSILLFLAARFGQNEIIELLIKNDTLNVRYEQPQAMVYLPGMIEQAMSAKYSRTAALLLNKLKYHFYKDPVKHKSTLIKLLRSAINYNLKSTVRCIDDMYMAADEFCEGTLDDKEYTSTLYCDYVTQCYTGNVVLSPDPVIRPSPRENIVQFEIGMLYHAVKLGLVRQVQVILKYRPLFIELLPLKLPGKNISILECSMQHDKLSQKLLTLLQENGVSITPDNMNNLWNYKKWYELLSKLPSTLEQHSPDLDTLACQMGNVTWVIDNFQRWNHVEEYQQVRVTIARFMQTLAESFRCSIYEFKPIRVGSSSEGTRPFIPNEFDYLLNFTEITKYFDCEEDNNMPGLLYKMRYNGKPCDEDLASLIHNGYFSAKAFKNKLEKLLKDAISRIFVPTFCDYLSIEHPFYESDRKKIHNMSVVWRGQIFKDMVISIDLVPAFAYPNVFPVITKCAENVAKGPYYLFTKQSKLIVNDTVSLPVAFSLVEGRIIRSLPQEVQQGFKLAKSLRRSCLFPNTIVYKLSKQVQNVEDYLTTYMLKTSLFYLAYTYGMLDNSPCSLPPLSPMIWAKRIYKQLLQFLDAGRVPRFFEAYVDDDDLQQPRGVYSEVFSCTDDKGIPEDKMRPCCVKRRNLIVIAEHMVHIIHSYLYERKLRAVKSFLDRI